MLVSPSRGHVWFLRVQRAPWDFSWFLCSRHSSLSNCQPSLGAHSGFSFKICIALWILCRISTSCVWHPEEVQGTVLDLHSLVSFPKPFHWIKHGIIYSSSFWARPASSTQELLQSCWESVWWEFPGFGRGGKHRDICPSALPWNQTLGWR